MIIDESTEFGARVAAHLRDEIVVWMTVVAPKSGPLPMPVWFLWEGGAVRTSSEAWNATARSSTARRASHCASATSRPTRSCR